MSTDSIIQARNNKIAAAPSYDTIAAAKLLFFIQNNKLFAVFFLFDLILQQSFSPL